MSLSALLDYLAANKEWIFSGAGISVLTVVALLSGRTLSWLRGASRGQNETKRQHNNQPTIGHRFEFSDGVVAYARILGSWEINNLFLFSKHFKSHDDMASAMASRLHSKAADILERYTYADAKTHRADAEFALKKEFSAYYKSVGAILNNITITPFIVPALDHKRPYPGLSSDRKAILLTSQSIEMRLDSGSTFRPLNMRGRTSARAHVQLVFRVTNPYGYAYGAAGGPWAILLPLVDAKIRQMLERFSITEARTRRPESEVALRGEIEPEFARFGLVIETVTIGILEAINPS